MSLRGNLFSRSNLSKNRTYDRLLRRSPRRPPRNDTQSWTVYILRCGDGSLYTGITRDMDKRLKAHRSGRGAAYTRSHLPLEVLYQEIQPTRAAAMVREAEIKSWPRRKKTALCAGPTPILR
jgi:predicted GIY-YIG superfamily endonuclease